MSQPTALRKRPLAAVLLAVMMFALIGLMPALPAHAEGESNSAPLSSVELIHDDADILDDQRVVDALNQLVRLDKLEDAQIAVYTSDEVSKDDYDADITELIKKDNDPLIMDDRLLSENIVVVTISPEVRQIGVYAREGSPLESKSAVRAATSEMTSYAQQEDWDNTAFIGASAYAEKLGFASRNDPAAVAEQQRQNDENIQSALYSFLIFAGVALVAAVLFVIGRALYKNRKRARKIKTLRATSRSVLETARSDWQSLRDAQDRYSELSLFDGILRRNYLVSNRVRLLDVALNPNSKSSDFENIRDHDIDHLLNPREHYTDVDELLTLLTYPPTEGKRAWRNILAELDGELRGIREIDEEIEALGLPEKVAKRVRTKAEKTVATIDSEIADIEKARSRDTDVLRALGYIIELIDDFEKYSKESVRSMSKDEYAQIVAPRRTDTAHTWHDHGYLFPAYALGIYAMAASSSGSGGYHSTGNSSSSGHSSYTSSPTSFSGGFSGGGFSGGSSGF